MKQLLVIHTGGTISMSQNEANQVTTNDVNPISSQQEMIGHYAQIDDQTPFNVPSPHMNIEYVNQLKNMIVRAEQDSRYDGYVITHGTDTLEETAFLLDLTLDVSKPVVLTGAMRSSNEIGADGLYNYISAIRVAASDDAYDKGVMVVFNDEIHTARNVTKTHTSNTDTFQSPSHGPLGIVIKTSVQFFHTPYHQHVYPSINTRLNVPLIKSYMGMPSDILHYYAEQDVDGIVIEALGQGNLPPSALPGIDACLAQEIPIVLVSRSMKGIVAPIYSYEGGGVDLEQRGVIFSNGLNGPKARLKLLVGLSNHLDNAALTTYFNS
ncbi:asparaginase [Staphylococcus argensis]|uniref:asparaginase n=1 Tax=Staphylococcus argensis TaxID=1607738 RepID=A0A2K4FF88_9STAP|nr:asparaginase [Staphylococcus argensis]MCY6990502.1 asparaginase [Staphylococcus argensis]POA10012.1 L-asparaginase [Staphylococcus argensis]